MIWSTVQSMGASHRPASPVSANLVPAHNYVPRHLPERFLCSSLSMVACILDLLFQSTFMQSSGQGHRQVNMVIFPAFPCLANMLDYAVLCALSGDPNHCIAHQDKPRRESIGLVR